MKKFTLVRYLKTTSGRNFRFKKKVELPSVPVIETGVKLKDGAFYLTQCITLSENGTIYVKVDDDPLIQDKDLDVRIAEYESAGWICSSYEDSN